MALTDPALSNAISRASQFDPTALGQVYDACYQRVFCYARFRLGDPARAHELCAQTFDQWLEMLKRSRTIDQLDRWLFETARRFIDQEASQASGTNNPNLTGYPEVNSPAMEDQAAWLNLLVRQSLRKLLPDQQHLLALRFGVPLSIEETSRVIGKGIAEVKGNQFEALLSLRGWLEKEA